MIAAIAAVAKNGIIGCNGQLPWCIPEETAWFEATIAGAALIVGRQTYQSMEVIPCDSFILTRQKNLPLRAGCQAVHSVEQALRLAREAAQRKKKDIFVLGGAEVYARLWPHCQYFYLTRISADFAGDARLPEEIPFYRWRTDQNRTVLLREELSQQIIACQFLRYVIE